MAANDTEADVLTGTDAVDQLVDTWQDIGMGMVNMDIHDPWFVVTRAGGSFRTFLSLVDSFAVTILDADADPSDIPDEYTPERGVTDDEWEMLQTAFDNGSGGAYPLPDKGVFAVAYRDGDEHRHLHVGLTDDTLTTVADE